jgi:hypothetical protein
VCAAVVLPCTAPPAHANVVINATFDPSITGDPNAVAIIGAIDSAIGVLEADVSTPITASIYFRAQTTGLGTSLTGVYNESYFNYYNQLKAIDTASGASAAQTTAFASLGPAPLSSSSGNPVNGSTQVQLTAPNLRALGVSAAPAVVVGSNTYDTVISLNTTITSPPNLPGGNYGLQSVAGHELDEAFGVGGPGSTLGGSPTGPVGVMDLYRYSAPGVRSYTTFQTNSPFAYFSTDGGATVLTYFSQNSGADYADWLSNPIPAGFFPQVQDAFGQPGTDPALGPNEVTALNVVGYDVTSSVTAPEPMSLAIVLPGVIGLLSLRKRTRKAKSG